MRISFSSYLCSYPDAHIAVQAVDRALIVDTLPSAEQADANAWAARMLGFGSVAGYFMYVHLQIPFVLSSILDAAEETST